MKKRVNLKQILIMLALMLVISSTVTGTLVYLAAKSTEQNNTFIAATVSCKVDGNAVENTSNIPAYIRIRVVANLVKNVDGNSAEYYPVSPDVTVSGTNWEEKDGYYYYTVPVAENSKTSEVSVTVTVPADAADANFKAQYQILAEAIQSVPKETVMVVWGNPPIQ